LVRIVGNAVGGIPNAAMLPSVGLWLNASKSESMLESNDTTPRLVFGLGYFCFQRHTSGTATWNVGRVKSPADDFAGTGYCKHESSLCATICWGSALVSRFVPLVVPTSCHITLTYLCLPTNGPLLPHTHQQPPPSPTQTLTHSNTTLKHSNTPSTQPLPWSIPFNTTPSKFWIVQHVHYISVPNHYPLTPPKHTFITLHDTLLHNNQLCIHPTNYFITTTIQIQPLK
jgi:hypothetical protein